jgi:hypothetical protein
VFFEAVSPAPAIPRAPMFAFMGGPGRPKRSISKTVWRPFGRNAYMVNRVAYTSLSCQANRAWIGACARIRSVRVWGC